MCGPPYVPGMRRVQKASDPLELDYRQLKVVMWMLDTELKSFSRTTSAPNH